MSYNGNCPVENTPLNPKTMTVGITTWYWVAKMLVLMQTLPAWPYARVPVPI